MKKSSVTINVPERITASGSQRLNDDVAYGAGNVCVSAAFIVVLLVGRVGIDPVGEGNIRMMRATVDYVAGKAVPARQTLANPWPGLHGSGVRRDGNEQAR
jgi:hypothetical protein